MLQPRNIFTAMDESMNKFATLLLWFIAYNPLYADPLLELAKIHLQNKEYYQAITECMRYQYCYPQGNQYPESVLIMSRAYFYGGNYYRATDIAYDCYRQYPDTLWGEIALYNLATMRLLEGSAFFAYRNYQEYFSIYPQGHKKEEAQLNFIYTKFLLHYYSEAKSDLDFFIANTGTMTLRDEAETVASLYETFEQRPRKYLWLSVSGSLVIPGFGHLYTGNYSTGILSLFSTSACAALAYRGYVHDNNFQLVFFGLAAFTFYQYSLVSAVINVYEYNSTSQLTQAIRVAIQKRF